MACSIDDTVFDFDLNFLRQTANIPLQQSRIEKQRKAICLAKKKIIATNSLIQKYYFKKESLDEFEKMLISSKEECKKICIDYKNMMEKCEVLEKEYERLKIINKELEDRTFTETNKQAAEKSFVNQLQLLVNDRDSQVQSLQKDNKSLKARARELERKTSKENNNIAKHLSSIANLVFHKRPLQKKDKLFLYKYLKNRTKEIELISDVENDDNEADVLNEVTASDQDHVESTTEKISSPPSVETEIKKQEINIKSQDTDQDSDVFSEAVSLDTGRGSSLAFSDSDKCFPSPEYYVDSPASIDTFGNKKQADSSTSPITVSVEIATSPIIFDVHIDEDTLELPDIQVTDEVTQPGSDTIPKILFDRAASPVQHTSPENTPRKVSRHNDVNKSVILNESRDKVISEEEVLQTNNSDNLNVNENDGEIEMILGTMRLSQDPVTPIPPTPAGSIVSKSRSTVCSQPEACPAASRLRKQNKIMQSSITDLAKELMSIKKILRSHVLHQDITHDDSTVQNTINETNSMSIDTLNDESTLDNIIEQFEYNSANDDCDDSNDEGNLVIEEQDEEIDTAIDQQQDSCPSSMLQTNTKSVLINKNINQDKMLSPEPRVPVTPIPVSSLLAFEQDRSELSECDEDSTPNNSIQTFSMNTTDPNDSITTTSKRRDKKLSRLEKIRKNILPKSKIKKVDQPISKKLRARLKRFPINDEKGKNMKSVNSLPPKEAYEKAVKVMSEIRSKQKEVAKTPKRNKNIVTRSVRLSESEKVVEENEEISKEISDSADTVNNRSQILNSVEKKPVSVKDQAKRLSCDKEVAIVLSRMEVGAKVKSRRKSQEEVEETNDILSPSKISKRTKRSSVQESEPVTTRILRSSTRIESSTKNDSNKNDHRSRWTNNQTDSGKKHGILSIESSTKNENNHRSRCNIDQSDSSMEHCEYSVKDFTKNDNNRKTRWTIDENIAAKDQRESSVESFTKNDNNQNDHRSKSTIDHNVSAKGHRESSLISYDDLESLNDDGESPKKKRKCLEKAMPGVIQNPQDSVLCKMISKHGITVLKNTPKKIPEVAVNAVSKKLEEGIARINELPAAETKKAMNDLVEDLQKSKLKEFISGLMVYLNDPERKMERFNKVNAPPAPPMTKSEQVLVYIVTRLRWPHVDLIDALLKQIEHALFRLNITPEFDVIETMSHFYAILCSYIKAKSRLRLFMLDGMYCMHYKAIPLVRQCIDVWMHILPLAHMGVAKSPLVVCLVYLLFFFKCEDKYNRVQDIRNILIKKYFFKLTEWNEFKILDMLKNAIKEVNNNPLERKMLRLALILVAKRHGARWCQSKIIQNIIQPLITQEDVPERVKVFSVSMLGPLMKPYPQDMKVHCEIVMNQLIDMLDQNCTNTMKETIFSSLMNMSRHNTNRVVQALLAWQPAQVSPAFEEEIKGFVRERPLRAWKTYLTKIPLIE